MNEETRATSITNIQVAKEVEGISSIDPGLGAYQFENLGELVQFSDLMSKADVMLPPHLRHKPAICLAVTMRAIQWKVDPFALAMETYQAKENGPIGYQAKVFVSALEACAGIQLNYEYEGNFTITNEPAKSSKGNVVAQRAAVGDRRCIAWVELKGRRFEYVSPRLDEITVKNSPLWHLDPDQQLTYYAARGWVRRHKPSVMMGAYSADEVESMEPMRDVTPKRGAFAQLAEDARHAAAETTDEDQAQTEGETSQDADQIRTNVQVEDPEVDTELPAYQNGVEAREGGLSRGDCPYPKDPVSAANWFAGWDSVESDRSEDSE